MLTLIGVLHWIKMTLTCNQHQFNYILSICYKCKKPIVIKINKCALITQNSEWETTQLEHPVVETKREKIDDVLVAGWCWCDLSLHDVQWLWWIQYQPWDNKKTHTRQNISSSNLHEFSMIFGLFYVLMNANVL